jgi:hypothetical protein
MAVMLLAVGCSDDDDGGSNATRASDTPTRTVSAGEDVPTREELKESVTGVYGSVELPQGACGRETINALIDINFDRLEDGTNADTFASGILTAATEINGLQEATDAEGAEELYEDIAAVVEDAYRDEGADETAVEGLMTEWRLNSLLESSLTSEEGCTISTG